MLDLRGIRYGLLVVRSVTRINDRRAWQCDCDCGKSHPVLTAELVRGTTVTCGCRGATLPKPEITVDYVRKVLNYDHETGEFTWSVRASQQTVGSLAGYKKNGYIYIRLGDRQYFAHVIAWLYVRGEWPTGKLDHEDTNRANNRLSNLRYATKAQNAQNRGKTKRNTSGYKGVWKTKSGRYQTAIGVDNEKIHLGLFDSPSDAALAYDAAAIVLHGKFARTNFAGAKNGS